MNLSYKRLIVEKMQEVNLEEKLEYIRILKRKAILLNF